MNIKELARNMRKNPTKQERLFWTIVKNRQFYGYRFLRQYCIDKYIVDFICKERKIIIEIDGGQHNEISNTQYDLERTKYLESIGYTVKRFWNNEIDNNIESVYLKLKQYFNITD